MQKRADSTNLQLNAWQINVGCRYSTLSNRHIVQRGSLAWRALSATSPGPLLDSIAWPHYVAAPL